jgi:hypothetical protein
MWDRFLDRAGVEDGEGVVEMEAKPMSAVLLLVKSKQGSTQGEWGGGTGHKWGGSTEGEWGGSTEGEWGGSTEGRWWYAG